MLHASTGGFAWKVIDEDVTLEWPVGHPLRLCCGDLPQRIYDSRCGVVIRIRVDYDAVLRATLLEVTLEEVAEFARTVDQAVIICSMQHISGGGAGLRCGNTQYLKRAGQFPTARNTFEADSDRKLAAILWVHQHLGIEDQVITDAGPLRFCSNLPSSLINLFHGKLLTGWAGCLHCNYVFCEIAHLIQRVPHWQLHLIASALGIVRHADVHAVMADIGEGNGVIELRFVLRLRGETARQQNRNQNENARPRSHAGFDNRAGSFS